ncbi:YjbF family lipoprotein [Mesobaculum littorinae]|nr:YjbF family lipoprotein [Mesobaculum littorinae]
MTGKTMRMAALLATALGVAACGSESGQSTLRNVTTGIVSQLGNRAPSRVTLSDQAIRDLGEVVVLTRRKNDDAALIMPVGRNGTVTTYESVDGTQLLLDRDVLVGTKGFGEDITSAQPPDVRRTRGTALRDHYYLNGDEVIRRARFTCTITDTGADSIEVAGRDYPSRKITEACSSDLASFENLYWIEADGTIRQSLQWVGPEVGSLVLERVHD